MDKLKIETYDFRPASLKEREERAQKVCEKFKEYTTLRPDVKPYKLMDIIAGELLMSTPGVLGILTRNGLYVKQRTARRGRKGKAAAKD